MRITWLLFVSGFALLSSAQQAAPRDSEATIRALERQWVEAQSQNNNRALALIFDNALVYVEYGNLVSKSEYLSRVRQEIPAEHAVVIEPLSVRTFGTTAIVVGSYRETHRKFGQILIKRWRFIDTWVYKTDGWTLVSAGASPIE